ncbi:MAG: hypothetical protein Q8R92_14720 [Deltaproteobacteria bacterium]|nr:hypothetical protein [Deltaproteobacteria bacterium]
MLRRNLVLGFVLLGIFWASPAGANGGTLYDLSGTATVRVGSVSQSFPVTAMLALNSDRTYLYQEDGANISDMGAWFELKGKLMLYTSNLLEQIINLEQEIGMEAMEPVQITPLKSKSRVTISPLTGVLSVRTDSSYQVFLMVSNLTVKVSTRSVMTGNPI